MIKSIYFSNRFFIILCSNVVLYIFGHYYDFLFLVSKVLTIIFIFLLIVDLFLLYFSGNNNIIATRETPKRLSNGDDNVLRIYITNNYNFVVKIKIIDEIPAQFQIRNFKIHSIVNPEEEKVFEYFLRPVKRGEYKFGNINLFVENQIGFVNRRYKLGEKKLIAVYPSYIQMRKYELMAISNRLVELGIKKIRKISNNNEFDQIREYVKGDDYRTINWKATARRMQFMVNQYQDEKSQQVYSLIDMGRTMKMPFEGMTLLDYAINASLVISNIAIYKQDKAGLISFSKKIHSIVQADRKKNQMMKILETLYRQETDYSESNHEALYSIIKNKIRQRSLLLLFTNFEGISSLKRQLGFLKQLNKHHLLVVIFFENTEIKVLLDNSPKNTEDIYVKTIAEKFVYEKKLIVKELNRNGINVVLTEPKNLTVDTINKYLQLKALGAI